MTDLRLAFRMLAKQPGMAVLAIIALALGIGLTTTMFSIVNGAVLRGLPFEESDRLYVLSRLRVAEANTDRTQAPTLHDYADWRSRQKSFDDLAAYYQSTANIVGPDGTPERYRGLWMTPNTLRLLNTAPVLGRDFRDGDEKPGAPPVVLISDKVWQERFKRDSNVVGQTMRVNGTGMTVVGVMAPKFAFPSTQELWVAANLELDPAKRATARGVNVIGRLRHGVSTDQARAEADILARQLEQELPTLYKGYTIVVQPLMKDLLGEITAVLTTMLVAVFGVLVIACANVANLVLARAADRTREVAVRTAVGASRFRVIRQMLVEVLVLASLGATAGLAIAYVGVTLFNRAIVDTSPPFWIDIRIDGTVMVFVTAIAVLSTVVAGLVPAWRASRTDLAGIMKDEGRSTGLRLGRFSRSLVIAEMALSFGLLVVSGMVIRSIINIRDVNFGFPMTDVLVARVVLPELDYPDDPAQRRFADAVEARIKALPGVVNAALATEVAPSAPFYDVKFHGQHFNEDRDYPNARGATVTPDYFAVLRTAAIKGRLFDTRDTDGREPVALVNQSFERKYFPNGAVGQQFTLTGENQPWRTIVGVVPDLGLGATDEDKAAEGFYLALAQRPPSTLVIVMHVAGPPTALSASVREAVRGVDANMPVFNVMTVEENKNQSTWPFRVFGSLFMAFGFASLFLATVGLYGVMAFSVSKRTQEIGIRMAMGAASRDVLRLVLKQGLFQVIVGMSIGVALGATLASFMQVFLFGVTPRDPLMFLAIAVVLGLTGMLACLIPARRAARVDPMTALRTQ
ncbi:MAG TPA: ABC transporter permease [Vicinamibacterales bacterium]|nr:ABC transporter permease [Vicinamibacterales bacterium]